MKLTWFGGTALRIHVGGRILVCDADDASGQFDPAELVSGADRIFGLEETLGEADPVGWQPKRAVALIAGGDTDVAVVRFGAGVVVVDATGEPPLVLVSGEPKFRARWTRDAVVVLLGKVAGSPEGADAVLESLGPRLIVLAGTDDAVDAAFRAIGDRLGGTGLVALELGMAIEV